MKRVTIPASIEEIEEGAFLDAQLREVTFSSGSRLRAVGECAFGGNRQLDRRKVHFPENARVSERVFDSVYGDAWDDFS